MTTRPSLPAAAMVIACGFGLCAVGCDSSAQPPGLVERDNNRGVKNRYIVRDSAREGQQPIPATQPGQQPEQQ